MKRSISTFGLLLTSISAIIGSGWLFSVYYTAEYAGPAALLSWVIGGAFIVIVAFVFAELCTMLPVSGSSVRIPQFTHGTVVSFLFAFLIWLSYLALTAIEVQAVVQYASFYFPSLVANESGKLSGQGYIWAIALMLLISCLNVFSLRWLIRCNNVMTIFKLLIPIIVIVFIFSHYFSVASIVHPAHSTFMPLGLHGVMGAVSMGGVMFAFNGFKQAAEMAGEAKNPRIAVPVALVGSVIFCLMIYLLLQFAFNASILPSNIAMGWGAMKLGQNTSPVATVLMQDHLKKLLPLLYIGAIVAPFAASLMYCSSAGRSLAGMSKNGYVPRFLAHLAGEGNPIYAIFCNFIFSLCLFAPLPGWGAMMAFLTSLLAITYGVGPICLIALRYQLPSQKRPLKLPLGLIWSFVAFYICTLLAYFSGWNIISKVGIAVLIGLLLLGLQRKFCAKDQSIVLNWRETFWFWFYIAGLTLISYMGNYGGGLGLLTPIGMLSLIAVFCMATVVIAVKFRLPAHLTQGYIDELHLEQAGEVQ